MIKGSKGKVTVVGRFNDVCIDYGVITECILGKFKEVESKMTTSSENFLLYIVACSIANHYDIQPKDAFPIMKKELDALMSNHESNKENEECQQS